VLLQTRQIAEVAARIEQAYYRRSPRWHRTYSDPRVWEVAATLLISLRNGDPSIPLDPELYVASQPIQDSPADPWRDLAESTSARRYRRRVEDIIRRLRNELRDELKIAERRIRRGETIEQILFSKSRRFSPLGRFILSYRAGRQDLQDRLLRAAQEQHRSCPLYREACRDLLPLSSYPVFQIAPGLEIWAREESSAMTPSLN
jgi:hypothetical protein